MSCFRLGFCQICNNQFTDFLRWPILFLDAHILEWLARIREQQTNWLGTAGEVEVVQLVLHHCFLFVFSFAQIHPFEIIWFSLFSAKKCQYIYIERNEATEGNIFENINQQNNASRTRHYAWLAIHCSLWNMYSRNCDKKRIDGGGERNRMNGVVGPFGCVFINSMCHCNQSHHHHQKYASINISRSLEFQKSVFNVENKYAHTFLVVFTFVQKGRGVAAGSIHFWWGRKNEKEEDR